MVKPFQCFPVLLTAALLLVRPAVAGRLTLQLEHGWGDVPLEVGKVAGRVAGRPVTVTRLAYLLSQPRLLTEGGEWVGSGGWVAYVDAGRGRTRCVLEGMPPGRYRALRFDVGLVEAVDRVDPAQRPPGHPLHPDVSGLHWGWRGGYVFLAMEGRVRRDDGEESGWSYHLAGEPCRGTVEVAAELDLQSAQVMSLRFDAARLFGAVHPIDPEAEPVTHAAGDDPLADRLAENVLRAFSLRRVWPDAERAPDVVAGETVARVPAMLAGKVPAHFPQVAWPADNEPVPDGVALGERLFRDVRLSGNRTQSCASCHQEAAALSDPRRFSPGSEGQPGRRQAMPLFNLAWKPSFFWDGRSPSLRHQVLQPIADPREMHSSPEEAVRRIAEDESYREEFGRVFGSPGVDAGRLALSLEQFLLTKISGRAKIDRVLAREAEFSESEARGFALFFGENDPGHGMRGADCFHCHGGAHFTNHQFADNGLDADGQRRDEGRFAVTGQESDRGKFMVPSLRNVALTAPYMYDGRLATLEAVVDHYNAGLQASAGLDANLARHRARGGLGLSAAERADLVAFLRTLTDVELEKR